MAPAQPLEQPLIRHIGPDDIDPVAASLGLAFADDPIFTFLVSKITDEQRGHRLQRFFRIEAKMMAKTATAWTTHDHSGAALWSPPDQWRVGGMDGLALGWAILRSAGVRSLTALSAMSAVEKAHPREPHWYLSVLGTRPERQGKGIGSALVKPVLERCDQEGLPAYLECSKESNVPYYGRFGFNVRQELPIAKNGPVLYLMWRDPH